MKMYTVIPHNGENKECAEAIKKIPNMIAVCLKNKYGDFHFHVFAGKEVDFGKIKGTVKEDEVTPDSALTVINQHEIFYVNLL